MLDAEKTNEIIGIIILKYKTESKVGSINLFFKIGLDLFYFSDVALS